MLFESVIKLLSVIKESTVRNKSPSSVISFFFLMSMKTALNQMAEKEENNELEEENEKNIELFHQLIQKNYGNILEFVKKELDN